MKHYIYKGKEYSSLYPIKQLLPNVGIPSSVTDEQLKALGITVKVVEPTIEELKENKLIEINYWTECKIINGFTSSCSGQAVKYDSDKDTQLTMQGIALNVDTPLFAEKYPQGCPVRGYAEGESTKTIFWLTPEQVMQWQADLSIHIGTCKQQGWLKQDEVAKATSKEDLDKIILD